MGVCSFNCYEKIVFWEDNKVKLLRFSQKLFSRHNSRCAFFSKPSDYTTAQCYIFDGHLHFFSPFNGLARNGSRL